ncbi:hypothetical protein D3C76_942840 [compost metagenome]
MIGWRISFIIDSLLAIFGNSAFHHRNKSGFVFLICGRNFRRKSSSRISRISSRNVEFGSAKTVIEDFCKKLFIR